MRYQVSGFKIGLSIAWISLTHCVGDIPSEPLRNQFVKDAWQLPVGEPVLPADEASTPLRKHCLVCHSPDYMTTQPQLTRKAWEANVEKMRSKYAAPIPSNAVPTIVDSLMKQRIAR
ncbi:MAG: hypothetical protein EXS25_11865 [Pedosphaera sp.]|nr:hypothetical protein [Pedosphaera sp.]